MLNHNIILLEINFLAKMLDTEKPIEKINTCNLDVPPKETTSKSNILILVTWFNSITIIQRRSPFGIYTKPHLIRHIMPNI